MQHLIKVLTIAAIMAPLPALARGAKLPAQEHFKSSAGTHNLLQGVALNAAEATRTITLSMCTISAGDSGGCWTKLRIAVFHTNSAATDVTATPTCSLDGTNYTSISSRSISSGTGTVSAYVDSNAVSGDEDFSLEYDVRGCQKFKVVFAGTSADGSDLINVQAAAYGE